MSTLNMHLKWVTMLKDIYLRGGITMIDIQDMLQCYRGIMVSYSSYNVDMRPCAKALRRYLTMVSYNSYNVNVRPCAKALRCIDILR